jgi:hypothetical protein
MKKTLIVKVVARGPQGAGGGGEGATEKTYTQPGHGFTAIPTPVYLSNGSWFAARADDNAKLATGHIVAIDGDDITVTIAGFKELTAHGITPINEFFYLGLTGGYTETEPEPSDCVMFVVDANNIVFLPYRPVSTAYATKLDDTDDVYNGLSEGQKVHALTGTDTVTVDYSATTGGNCHIVTMSSAGALTITLGNDWPDNHDAVTLLIKTANLTGITWTDQASFVNVGDPGDYISCAAHDAGTVHILVRIEKINGELYYFESSVV